MTEKRDEFSENDFVAPDGVLEVSVARIQAEVLGIDRIGRTDSFYDLGGTSIHAVRICSRIEREVGYRAEIEWLLMNDVLADFVDRLERGEVDCG